MAAVSGLTPHRPLDSSLPSDNDLDWGAPIDRRRRFTCETVTPLYYTSVYRELTLEQRLRYNQLTGLYQTELVGFLEEQVLAPVLESLATAEGRGSLPDELRLAVGRLVDDERRHAEMWGRLKRLSEPRWYASSDLQMLQVPRGVCSAARWLARWPGGFPALLWIQLAQEERSVEISRRSVRTGRELIEPHYAAVHRAHLKDEVRHVQLDRDLIVHCYPRRSLLVRRVSAAFVRLSVGAFFLIPARSTERLIDVLLGEFPELLPIRARIFRELRALDANDDYQAMMYSRRTSPITFALFDQFPEFRAMQKVLRSYRPPRAGATYG